MTNNGAGWDGAILGDFYTVKETAQYLRLCEKQTRRLIERGELAAYRFGAAIRIKKKDVDEYVRRNAIYK